MLAKILRRTNVGPYVRLRVHAPRIAREANPGQFIHVKAIGEQAPFWRRPFSICRVKGQAIELLIKPRGIGSTLISQLPLQAALDIIGPLGHGFTQTAADQWILVGGGYGTAPLLFLADRLRAKKQKVHLLHGARCEKDLFVHFPRPSKKSTITCATDDGSKGHHGKVTEVLIKLLRKHQGSIQIAACGPRGMLAEVARLAHDFNVSAQVSLEETLACGIGVCNGCVIKVQGQYRRVCHDGPVFFAQDVEWKHV